MVEVLVRHGPLAIEDQVHVKAAVVRRQFANRHLELERACSHVPGRLTQRRALQRVRRDPER